MKTLVFPKKLFFENSSFWYLNSGCVLKQLFDITEKKTGTENQQLFDGIIDVTLFDGVEGLNYTVIGFSAVQSLFVLPLQN